MVFLKKALENLTKVAVSTGLRSSLSIYFSNNFNIEVILTKYQNMFLKELTQNEVLMNFKH